MLLFKYMNEDLIDREGKKAEVAYEDADTIPTKSELADIDVETVSDEGSIAEDADTVKMVSEAVDSAYELADEVSVQDLEPEKKEYSDLYKQSVKDVKSMEDALAGYSFFKRLFDRHARDEKRALRELKEKQAYMKKRFTQEELRRFYDEALDQFEE